MLLEAKAEGPVTGSCWKGALDHVKSLAVNKCSGKEKEWPRKEFGRAN